MIKVSFDSLREFAEVVGFWGGARDNWRSFSEAQKDLLEAVADTMEFESITSVNDFVWFAEDDFFLEWEE